MRLQIAANLLERIRDHARISYPCECCGFLLGHFGADTSVCDLGPVENQHGEARETRYLISPRDWLKTEMEAAERGLEIIGVYHSHPDHPAIPSEFDREHALPMYSYIIVSVRHGSDGELSGWILREDRTAFEREELLASEHGEEVGRCL
jgi:proteasome lid subunit RPN8/RPN11